MDSSLLLQVIFIINALVILLGALFTVTARNLVHAALWMVLSLFGTAVMFVILGTGFFAVVQVVIYIGAIAVLILFAIMLTRREMNEKVEALNKRWWVGAMAAIILLGVLVWVGVSHPGAAVSITSNVDDNMVKELGKALVEPDRFALVFEISSLLLLVAMIGAIYLAQDRKTGKEVGK